MTVTETYLNNLYKLGMENPKLQSDFARKEAFFIAEAASNRHITSVIEIGATNQWYLTKKGFKLLQKEGYL